MSADSLKWTSFPNNICRSLYSCMPIYNSITYALYFISSNFILLLKQYVLYFFLKYSINFLILCIIHLKWHYIFSDFCTIWFAHISLLALIFQMHLPFPMFHSLCPLFLFVFVVVAVFVFWFHSLSPVCASHIFLDIWTFTGTRMTYQKQCS